MKMTSRFLLGLLVIPVLADNNNPEEQRGRLLGGVKFFLASTCVCTTGTIGYLASETIRREFDKTKRAVRLLGLVAGGYAAWKILYAKQPVPTEKTSQGTVAAVDGNDAKVTITDPTKIKETFASVGGALTAKRQLKELVVHLQQPEKIQEMGGKPARGILLIGKPGNGKTLLARAMAKEAGCNFIAVSSGFFASKYMNVGAERVKALFEIARAFAPCIVFIDEIDNIGATRESSDSSSGRLDHNATLTELLAQMDGFDSSGQNVCVIAATNRPQILDKALTRSGRFDQHIVVPAPDFQARLDILKIHTKKTPLDKDVNLVAFAQSTMGRSGADLANMINQAIAHAVRYKRTKVNANDLDWARDNVIMGQERPEVTPTKEQAWKTAIHESGHTVVGMLAPNSSYGLYKVTITARGSSLGSTHFIVDESAEYQGNTREELLARVATALGGSVAEELIFNSKTTGVSADFAGAYQIAREMVCTYGMSALGAAAICNPHLVSNELKASIDSECRKIIQEAEELAKNILLKNKDKLTTVATALMRDKTLTGDQTCKVMGITRK